MKKLFTLLLLLLSVGIGSQAYSQVFFSEDFEGTMNATTDLPTGWTETGLSTDGIWSTDSAAVASSNYIAWPAPNVGSIFAYTNDDDCDCDKSNDRMLLPTQNFSAYAGVVLTCDLFLNGGYGETGYVLASNNGGVSFDTVQVVPGGGSAWQFGSIISLSAYAGDTAVTIAFAYNDAATWAFAMGVDNLTLTGLTSTDDMELLSVAGEYSLIPESQISAMPLEGTVTNNGLGNLTDVILTADVYSSSNGFATPVATASSPMTTVNAGDTMVINAGSYTPPSGLQDYRVDYVVSSASINDAIPANDSADYSFTINTLIFARDDSLLQGGLGVNGLGNTSILGNNYTFDTTATVNSVSIAVTGTFPGDTTRLFVYNTDTIGMPTTVIDSFQYIFVDTGIAIETIPIPGGMALNQGEYFFGIKEMPSLNNLGLGYMDNYFTPGTSWGSVNGGAYNTIEDIGFNITFYVRLNLDNGCVPTALTIDTTICDGDFVVIAGNQYDSTGTYTINLTNAAGCDSVITTNLTVNSLPTASFTGLDTLYCSTDAAVTLTGTPAGGVFSGNGITGNMFDPTAVAVGFHTIVYTFTDANGCADSESMFTQVDICQGIGEGIFGNISVSPNPNNGIFTLTGLEPGMGVKLYSMHGQVVYESTVSYQEERIELEEKAAGTYFLWLTKEDQSYQMKIRVN